MPHVYKGITQYFFQEVVLSLVSLIHHNLTKRDKILFFLCCSIQSCQQPLTSCYFYWASMYVCSLILKSRMYTQDIPRCSVYILSISFPPTVWCQLHFAAIICHFQHSSCSLPHFIQGETVSFIYSLNVMLHSIYSAVKILIVALSMLFCDMKVV